MWSMRSNESETNNTHKNTLISTTHTHRQKQRATTFPCAIVTVSVSAVCAACCRCACRGNGKCGVPALNELFLTHTRTRQTLTHLIRVWLTAKAQKATNKSKNALCHIYYYYITFLLLLLSSLFIAVVVYKICWPSMRAHQRADKHLSTCNNNFVWNNMKHTHSLWPINDGKKVTSLLFVRLVVCWLFILLLGRFLLPAVMV